MSPTQFLVLAAAATLVTIPIILLIPRTRSSAGFNRLLWAATLLVAFLTGWVAVAMAQSSNLLTDISIAATPVLPALLGGLFAALVLNLPLWLLDRLEPGGGGEPDEEEPEEREEQEERL